MSQKKKIWIAVIAISIAAVGCYLINDVRIISGVFLMIYANNLSFGDKNQIDD